MFNDDDPIEEIDGEEEEEEDDDDDDAEVEESASSSFRARQSAQKFGLLLDTFTDNQNARYEAFRQSSFPKAGMKKVIMSYTGYPVPPSTLIVMSGIAKLYCGEIVELARQVQTEWEPKKTPEEIAAEEEEEKRLQEEDAKSMFTRAREAKPKPSLKPHHIREAVRRLKLRGRAKTAGYRIRKPFRS